MNSRGHEEELQLQGYERLDVAIWVRERDDRTATAATSGGISKLELTAATLHMMREWVIAYDEGVERGAEVLSNLLLSAYRGESRG